MDKQNSWNRQQKLIAAVLALLPIDAIDTGLMIAD
jgi:hypothetical protein